MQRQATTKLAKPAFTPLPFGVIQRKCDCGGSAGVSGECEECQEKQLSINRYSTDRRSPSGLLPSPADLAQSTMLSDSGAGVRAGAGHHFGRLRVGAAALSGTGAERAVSQPGDRSEVEADRAAERVMRALSSPVFEEKQESPILSHTPPLIQREVADEGASEVGATPESTTEPETAATQETPAPGLIVEDDASEVGPGQMRKSDFLAQLNAEIYAAADEILVTRGRTAQSCPYITNWFEYGYARSGSYVETFVRRFTPGSDRAASASEYIPLAVERVRRALLVWANTGEITGVPESLAGELPATNQKGAVASLGAQVGAEGEGAATGALLAKAREGGSAGDSDPRDVQNQLRAGEPLDSGVKTRMESAFGYNFSRVRVHRNAGAARLSTRLNARAFTVGHDVAFAAGEYRPGTLVGDALLAHELAHVVQQGGGQSAIAQKPPDLSVSNSLEEDADRSAVGAVVALWGKGNARLSRVSENVLPSLRSGLRLSRCDSCKSSSEKIPEKQPEGAPQKEKSAVPASPPGEGWVRNDTPGGQKFGSGDIEGTYYIDASTTAKGQKVPAKGNPAIFQPNYVGAYVNFSDKSKGSNCAGGSGNRLWLSYKYYKELTIAGAAAPSTPLDQWSVDISGNFITNKVDFEDLPGLQVPGKEGIAGYARRSYHIGVVCSCASDPTKQVKGFLSEYSFNLDIWFNGSDAAVRVSPGDSYGGPVDWCKTPPSGVTCVDACPAPASGSTTTPTEPKKTP